jgi:hypothetical protein
MTLYYQIDYAQAPVAKDAASVAFWHQAKPHATSPKLPWPD